MAARLRVNLSGPGRFNSVQDRLRAPCRCPPRVKIQAVPDESRYPTIPVVEDAGQAWNDVPQYDVEQHQVNRPRMRMYSARRRTVRHLGA